MTCATKTLSWQDADQHCKSLDSTLLQSLAIPLKRQNSCAVHSTGLWVGAKLSRKAKIFAHDTVAPKLPETFSNECPEDNSKHQTKCAVLKKNGMQVTCTQIYCGERHPFLCFEPKAAIPTIDTTKETGPIIAPLTPVTTFENSSVTLQCNATGNPTPTNSQVNWYFNGSRIASGSTLKLTKVAKEQAGQYTCTVIVQSRQSQKKLAASRNVTLTVHYPPQIATHNGDIQLIYSALYQEINFTVTVLANPMTVTFTWFKQNIKSGNYYEVSGDDSKHVVHSGKLQSSLLISNLSASEFTNYSVKADNNVYEGTYFYFQLKPRGCPTFPQLDQVSSTADSISITWRPGRDGGYPQTVTLKLCNDTECQVVDQRKRPEHNKQSVTRVDGLPSRRCFSLILDASNEHKEKNNDKGCSVQAIQHDVCTKGTAERQMICKRWFAVMYQSKTAVLRWDKPERQVFDRQVVEQWQGTARGHQQCTESPYCQQIDVPLDQVCLTVDMKTREWYTFRLVHYLNGRPVSTLTATELVERDKNAENLGYCGFAASLLTLLIMTSMLLLREKVPLSKPATSESNKSLSSVEMAAIQQDNTDDTKDSPTD